MAWPEMPPDDDQEMRRALDRANRAVQDKLGVGYPIEYIQPLGGGEPITKVGHIVQVAVEAALRGSDDVLALAAWAKPTLEGLLDGLRELRDE